MHEATGLTFAAAGVSLATGAVIAAGGLLGRPLLWFAIPPLVFLRLRLAPRRGYSAGPWVRGTSGTPGGPFQACRPEHGNECGPPDHFAPIRLEPNAGAVRRRLEHDRF